tara:strand:- start:2805 stop:3293 length:489 start_codon:yes stop_codon:yes gene_type:complete
VNILKKNWILIILVVSIGAITSALVAEYFFKILPCQMCLYQRYPYYLLIIVSLIFFIIKKFPLSLYYWINNFLFLFGLFFSIWHVGIEQKVLPGLAGCSNNIVITESIESLKDQIINQDIINCTDITWSFVGISFATYNTILLIFLLIINIKFTLETYYQKK